MGLRPKRDGESIHRSPLLIAASAFFGWQVLSAITTVYWHDTLLELGRVGTCFTWFLIARTLLRDGLAGDSTFSPDDSQLLSMRLRCLLGALALGTLLEIAVPIWVFVTTRISGQMGTYYNINLFANYCAISVPICLALAADLARGRSAANQNEANPYKAWMVGALMLALMVLLAVIQSRSKGGFLAALIGLAAFAVCLLRAERARVTALIKARPALVVGLSLLLLVGGGAVASKTVIPRLMQATGSENHSTVFRAYTWSGTLRMAQARPVLGFGPGSFPSAYTAYAETGYTRSAHEVWLQIAAENGFPALLLLAACCVLVQAKGWRLLKTENWPVAAGAIGGLAAFIAHGLLDSGWGMTSIALIVFILFAAVDALPNPKAASGTEEPERPASGSQLRIEWLLACMLVAGASYFAQKAAGGEDLRSQAVAAIRSGNTTEALERAREATQTNTLSARHWTLLADTTTDGKENAEAAERAIALQPTRALSYLRLAEYKQRFSAGSPADAYKRAVELDPHDTNIRWSRGEWRLAQGDKGGWEDIEAIARDKDAPYGKYPATPELVDLNYARAFIKLGERAANSGDKAKANEYARRADEVLKMARQYQKQNEDMAAAMGQAAPESPAALESQLDQLKERTQ